MEDGEAGRSFVGGLESILVGGLQLFDSLVDIGDLAPTHYGPAQP